MPFGIDISDYISWESGVLIFKGASVAIVLGYMFKYRTKIQGWLYLIVRQQVLNDIREELKSLRVEDPAIRKNRIDRVASLKLFVGTLIEFRTRLRSQSTTEQSGGRIVRLSDLEYAERIFQKWHGFRDVYRKHCSQLDRTYKIECDNLTERFISQHITINTSLENPLESSERVQQFKNTLLDWEDDIICQVNENIL